MTTCRENQETPMSRGQQSDNKNAGSLGVCLKIPTLHQTFSHCFDERSWSITKVDRNSFNGIQRSRKNAK